MNSLWHHLLVFLGWFAVAAGVAAMCYALLRLQTPQKQEKLFFVALGACVCLHVVLFQISSVVGSRILTLGIAGLVLCIPAAYCEEARQQRRDDWGWNFCLALLTSLLTLVIGGILVALVQGRPMSFNDSKPFWLGIEAGLIVAPFSISFFRWMIPHLHLRPGVDRHFKKGEVPK